MDLLPQRRGDAEATPEYPRASASLREKFASSGEIFGADAAQDGGCGAIFATGDEIFVIGGKISVMGVEAFVIGEEIFAGDLELRVGDGEAFVAGGELLVMGGLRRRIDASRNGAACAVGIFGKWLSRSHGGTKF